MYLVHRAVVAYVSRAPRAAIRPHCSALPAPCRLLRCASRRRWGRPSDTPLAPLPRPHYALIGCRPPIGRLHIVYRLSRCIARSLRSLAIKRSSRSSQSPQGHWVGSSLPLHDHRHIGGRPLARCRLHISLLRGRRGRRAPCVSGCRPRARGCALSGAALAFARAKVCLLGCAVSRPYRFVRCGSPTRPIASGTLLRPLLYSCVRAPPCLLGGAKRPPSS